MQVEQDMDVELGAASGDVPVPPPANDREGGDPSDRSDIYGTFFIGGNEFAVSVESIQEVVNEPDVFTAVPLSPDYLVGLFNLRGLIIPVVDLRIIFDLPIDPNCQLERKVAIIEHGEHCFGLLVDKTGDVFNARDTDHNEFSRVRGDIREAIVGGVFKLEEGRRLVQILDPFELLKLEKLPRVSGASHSALAKRSRGRRKQCISFRVGDCLCAFNMTSIKEIVELDTIDNTALAHGWTLGAVDLRGSTVPVIDFRVFLGKKQITSSQEVVGKGYKLIVMKIGSNLISLLVDAIDNIISYFDDDLLSFPGLGLARSDMFKGCLATSDNEMVLLLDHKKVLEDNDLTEVTRGHSNLFRAGDEAVQAERKGDNRKRTFITFSVGSFSVNSKFALDISHVNEVISYPETVVHPPSLPTYIEGMVNLRGDLIPIINLRALYHLEDADPEMSKLLIFSRDGKKYGIMVDTVDSIVSFSERNASPLPRISDGSRSVNISNDIKEAIVVESDKTEKQSLMVLDLDMVISRSLHSSAA